MRILFFFLLCLCCSLTNGQQVEISYELRTPSNQSIPVVNVGGELVYRVYHDEQVTIVTNAKLLVNNANAALFIVGTDGPPTPDGTPLGASYNFGLKVTGPNDVVRPITYRPGYQRVPGHPYVAFAPNFEDRVTFANGKTPIVFSPANVVSPFDSILHGPDMFGHDGRAASGVPLQVRTVTGKFWVSESWQNPVRNTDVNQDGFVSPLDALIVANYFTSVSTNVPLRSPTATDWLVDVNGDKRVTPLDAIMVLNDQDPE